MVQGTALGSHRVKQAVLVSDQFKDCCKNWSLNRFFFVFVIVRKDDLVIMSFKVLFNHEKLIQEKI